MKFLLSLSILIFFTIPVDAQIKIGLGDLPNSNHQATSISMIQSLSNAPIVTDSMSMIIRHNDFNTDTIVVTANPYTITNTNNYQQYVYRDNYTLHIVSAVNTFSLPPHMNYSKNLLTVLSADGTSLCNTYNHQKIDLIIPTQEFAPDCATSWASSLGAAMIYNIIDTFRIVNHRLPYSFEMKCLLLNTANDSFIDTVIAKRNLANTLVDSILKFQSNIHQIPIDKFYDSIKVTLYYHDSYTKKYVFGQNLNLVDTITMNGSRLINVEYKTYYNISQDIPIQVDFINGYSNKQKYALSWRYYETTNTLPVELTYFEVSTPDPLCQTVFLSWQTASEQNNSHFEVQRSPDGEDFETIGLVSGNGTTVEAQSYVYIDKLPLNGDNYYRLKQVDFDGTDDYSETRHVQYIQHQNQKSIIYQGNTLRVNNTSVLFNMQGQLIDTFNHSFDTSALHSGAYFVRSADGQVLKFLK